MVLFVNFIILIDMILTLQHLMHHNILFLFVLSPLLFLPVKTC